MFTLCWCSNRFPRLNATHTSEIPFVFDMGIALGAKDKPYAIQMNGYWSRVSGSWLLWLLVLWVLLLLLFFVIINIIFVVVTAGCGLPLISTFDYYQSNYCSSLWIGIVILFSDFRSPVCSCWCSCGSPLHYRPVAAVRSFKGYCQSLRS